MILHWFTSSSEGAISFERQIVILLIPLNNNCKKIIKKNYYPLKKIKSIFTFKSIYQYQSYFLRIEFREKYATNDKVKF